MNFSKQQLDTLGAAAVFLVAAIFMLVNTFAENATWAFWVGLGLTAVAVAVYVLLVVENRKLIAQKLRDTTAQPAEALVSAAPDTVQENS